MRKGLTIKSKLVLILISISLLSILVIGFLGWRNNNAILQQEITSRLTAIRRTKAEQVQAYFNAMRDEVEILGENDMIVEGMISFNRAFRTLRNQEITEEIDRGLENFYTAQFFPKLFANLAGQADYTLYRPTNPAGIYLQYQYIAANPYQSDLEKMLFDDAKDGSEYSRQHAYYHPRLRNIIQKFGFDDLLLVNIENGDVVYTTAKQTELGSNLRSGAYRQSNVAHAYELTLTNAERDNVQLVDFELYRAAYGLPTAFWSVPLYNGPHLVGVMMIQISLGQINKLMTYNGEWMEAGLGQTGEVYLVGQDLLMRSNSRFLLEDPASYFASLRANGVPERTVGMIEKLGTSILFHRLNSTTAREATSGREGFALAIDYRQQPVLSAYQPINLETLQWGIVAEIDQAEAFAPIYEFQRNLLIATVLMIVLCAFGAVAIAGNFLRPIQQVLTATRQTRAGNLDIMLPVTSKDELGELSASFNDLLQGIRQQNTILGQKQQEIEQLRLTLLPAILVQRLHKGETQILEEATAISLLSGRLTGWYEVAQQKTAPEMAQLLQEMMADLDEAAARQDLEKFAAGPQRFVGICALSRPHLDHSRRAVEFALAAKQIVQRFNQKHQAKLQVSIAIHAGAITAGLIGVNRPIAELWGETVNIVEMLSMETQPNTILVTQTVYEQLKEQYKFQRYIPSSRETTQSTAWIVEGAVA